MKLRKVLFLGAVALALTASFAFKAKKGNQQITYWTTPEQWECAVGYNDGPDDCIPAGGGARCTEETTGQPAFAGPTVTSSSCTFPLYHSF